MPQGGKKSTLKNKFEFIMSVVVFHGAVLTLDRRTDAGDDDMFRNGLPLLFVGIHCPT